MKCYRKSHMFLCSQKENIQWMGKNTIFVPKNQKLKSHFLCSQKGNLLRVKFKVKGKEFEDKTECSKFFFIVIVSLKNYAQVLTQFLTFTLLGSESCT